MGGTGSGGKQAAETNKRLYGADFYPRIGSIGGNTPKTKPSGFASQPRERVVAWGKKGGAKSSRKGIKQGQGKKALAAKAEQARQRKARELTGAELHTMEKGRTQP